MPFAILFTKDAVRDLQVLHRYIAENDSPRKAGYVLGQIETLIMSLSELPQRGAVLSDISMPNIRDYREVFFKPYRIIYQVKGEQVYIHLIADGRRDMRSLLQRRLLSE